MQKFRLDNQLSFVRAFASHSVAGGISKMFGKNFMLSKFFTFVLDNKVLLDCFLAAAKDEDEHSRTRTQASGRVTRGALAPSCVIYIKCHTHIFFYFFIFLS
jgi:hypothetical protein